MKEHWDAYCALSLVHFLAYPEAGGGEGPIAESIVRIAEDDFFSAIEVSRINDPAERKRAAQAIEQTHMGVAFGAQPVILGGKLDPNSLDAAERRRAVQTLQSYMGQAAELGARQFVVMSGPDAAPADRPAAMAALAASLRELCSHAAQFGLAVWLETFDRAVDKKALIGPAGQAAALAAEIRRDFPDFGLIYDQAHMALLDESPLAALTLLKDHLRHAHVGNCVKVPGRPSHGDLHPRFGFLGGEHDVPELVEYVRALFAVGYLRADPPIGARPWLGFEIKPQSGETTEAVLANLKRVWREAWARV
jgi:sugar phosphate isomerase/epimerase